MRSLASLTLLAVLCSSFVSTSAVAQRARPSRQVLEQARTRMEQGQAYFLQGRFAEAAAEFDAAYGIHPFSAFLFNAGVAYETTGDLTHAIEYFRRYVATETNASERAEVETRIASVEARVREREERLARERAEREAALAAGRTAVPTPPPEQSAEPVVPAPQVVEQLLSLVAVETEPAGATVTVSNASGTVATGTAPLEQTLPRGTYHIVIEHPDYNRFERDIDVQPGVFNRLFLNLSQGEFLGYVRVRSDPAGAGVIFDDREAGARGQTPFEGPLQAGHHHVWIERQGYEPIERAFDVAVGDEVRIDVDLERVSYGRLRVVGNLRGARVYIDGAQVGAVPWEGQVEGGTRIVRVEQDGMKAWEAPVEVARGQLRPIRVRLRPAMGRGGAIVAGIIGGLSLGGGIGISIYVSELHGELERASSAGTLQLDDSRLPVGYWMSIAQFVGYGLAAVAGSLALFYALYDDLPPSEGTVLDPRDWTLLPMLSPGGGAGGDVFGLSLSGRL
jgi:hypothetical protein